MERFVWFSTNTKPKQQDIYYHTLIYQKTLYSIVSIFHIDAVCEELFLYKISCCERLIKITAGTTKLRRLRRAN